MSDIAHEEKMQKALSEAEILERALLCQAEVTVASEERCKKLLDEMERKKEEAQAALRRKDEEMSRKDEEMSRKDEEMRRMRAFVQEIMNQRNAALEQRDAVNMMNESLMDHIDRTTPLLLRGRNA